MESKAKLVTAGQLFCSCCPQHGPRYSTINQNTNVGM